MRGKPMPLVKGRVYVVEGVCVQGGLYILGVPVGIPYINLPGDVSWNVKRFRKLDELKAESEARYYINHPELAPA
jgi:hypothetical protein